VLARHGRALARTPDSFAGGPELAYRANQ